MAGLAVLQAALHRQSQVRKISASCLFLFSLLLSNLVTSGVTFNDNHLLQRPVLPKFLQIRLHFALACTGCIIQLTRSAYLAPIYYT